MCVRLTPASVAAIAAIAAVAAADATIAANAAGSAKPLRQCQRICSDVRVHGGELPGQCYSGVLDAICGGSLVRHPGRYLCLRDELLCLTFRMLPQHERRH